MKFLSLLSTVIFLLTMWVAMPQVFIIAIAVLTLTKVLK